ncbi:MAG: molybdopterin-dependent oxidoreductase, partial [bacterium]
MTEIVGKSVTKIDALSLATGDAKFVDDFNLPDTAIVKIMYSPHAHARIIDIDTSEAESIEGVVDILCYKNVKRILHTTAGQGAPEPSPYDTVMFDNKVRFVGDRVAAVLAENETIAIEAISKIKVQYEIVPALLDYEKAMESNTPIIHEEDDKYNPIQGYYLPEKNIAGHIEFHFGNLDQGFKDADLVLDHTYRTGYASHCMIEPHSVFSYLDERNRLVIISSTQVPFHVRRICAQLLEIPLSRIRVIKPRIGGGFGGKQEVFLEYVAALFTLRTNRPVKLILSREEVFKSSRTRHPMRVRCKTGIKKDGTITSIDYDVLMNTGAYGAHGLTVLTNAGSKVLPLVNKVPNIKFCAYSVYSNLPVGGAYRGYGVTQSMFAFGQQMDIMARAINMDVVDFYLQNQIREGETSAVFEYLGEGKAGTAMNIE